jgi:hypothetical protein
MYRQAITFFLAYQLCFKARIGCKDDLETFCMKRPRRSRHLNIINGYFEGSSMGKIAKKLDRSAATVHAQIHGHNEDIDKQGYCAECRRLKGTHEAHKTDSRTA